MDRDGYRQTMPTADEVIANTRPDASDGVVSAWQARSLGHSLLLIGDVSSTDGALTWWVSPGFEMRPGEDNPTMRVMQVFPPADDAVINWSWRPLDAETWKAVGWDDVAARVASGAGRRLHEELLAEEGDAPARLSPSTPAKAEDLRARLVRRAGPDFGTIRVIALNDARFLVSASRAGARIDLLAEGDPSILLPFLGYFLGVHRTQIGA